MKLPLIRCAAGFGSDAACSQAANVADVDEVVTTLFRYDLVLKGTICCATRNSRQGTMAVIM